MTTTATPFQHRPASGFMVRFMHAIKAIALILPIPTRTKVKLYYSIFTDFFVMLGQGSHMLNYGQEGLCDATVSQLPKQGKWLDVGCGVGGPATYLAKAHPQLDITGINITPHQVALAQDVIRQSRVGDRVRVIEGDACNMPFAEGKQFDGLYAIETAFHFPDKAAFAREAKRVLKPGAKFACADMVIRESGIEGKNSIVTQLFHNWLGVMSMYTATKWKKTMEDAGFTNVEIEDVTATALKDGLQEANRRIDAQRDELEKVFPKFLIKSAYKGNQWILENVEARPIRYIIFRATA